MSAQSLTTADTDVIISLACSLDESPGTNWVQEGGGLPEYICQVAKAIKKDGKTTSTAIAMAVSRVKKWAVSGEGDTKAKAAKAVAEWERLKSKSHTSGKASKVKATNQASDNEIISLAKTTLEYSMDDVRKAYENTLPKSKPYPYPTEPYVWVAEVWNTHLIVKSEGPDSPTRKIPYAVTSEGIEFDSPIDVKQTYVPLSASDDTHMTDSDILKAMVLCGPCAPRTPLSKFLRG